MNSYNIGTAVQLTGTFQSNKQPFDPATLALYLQAPCADAPTLITTGFVNPTPGTWNYNFVPDISGVWLYQFQAGGNCNAGTNEGTFLVLLSTLIPTPTDDGCPCVPVLSADPGCC